MDPDPERLVQAADAAGAFDQGTDEQARVLAFLNDQSGVARWELRDRPWTGQTLVITLDDGRIAHADVDGSWRYV